MNEMENRRPNVCPTVHLPPQSVRFVVETQKRRMDAIVTAGEGSAYHHSWLKPPASQAKGKLSQRLCHLRLCSVFVVVVPVLKR